MSYIGNKPATAFETVQKQISTSNSGTTITLDRAVTSVQDILVTIDAVVQSYDNYSVSGTTLTVGGTLSNNRVEILYVGRTMQTVSPDTGTVTLDMLSASGTKDATTFLRGDNTFATVSGTTINNNADNRVITGSGSANTLEGEANLTFDGTQLSILDSNEGTDNLLVKTTSDNSISMALEKSDLKFDIGLDHNNDGSQNFYIRERHQGGSNTNAVRMEIDNNGVVKANSKLVIDNTVVAAFKLNIEAGGNSESGIVINDKDAASNFPFLSMRRSGTVIGSIERNGSNDSVNYQTTSDYRLKENEENISDGIERLKQLKPYKFNWKSNPSGDKVDGFFAHEVQTVVPEAISKTKDAVDSEGNIDPQGIDQSKLVPLLTSALQEAITKIETLEARVQTLENA